MELPGVDPPENEVDNDAVPPLLKIDHGSNNESDDRDEDTDTHSQRIQRVFHPEAMPPTVRNVYNLCPQK